MKVGTVLAALLLATAAVAGTYWVARSDATSKPSGEAGRASPPAPEAEEPVPSKTGPHPKAVLSEKTYDFGVMAAGTSQKHTFVVRNEGEAPLRLGKPETTCQCTISEAARDAIPPGGEGTITLEWKPFGPTQNFDKGAVIRTNDPKQPKLTLAVVGQVDTLLRIEPEGNWDVGDIGEALPEGLSGYLFSRILDRFEVTSITTTSPLVAFEAEPVAKAELRKGEKSAYRLRAKLAPGLPAGRLFETVTLKTDAGDPEVGEIKFNFVGMRKGPVQILALPGTKWSANTWSVDLGRFPAAQGKSAAVSLFVSDMPEGREMTFSDVQVGDPFVSVDLVRDAAFAAPNRQRYVLTFAAKPGGPVVTRKDKGAVKIEAKTNHPALPSMKFTVQFISTP